MTNKIINPPKEFDGTLNDFFDHHSVKILMGKPGVELFHKQFSDYYRNANDPLFLVRQVTGLVRRETIRSMRGYQIRATDNSPSWFIHYSIFSGQFDKISSFDAFLKSIPCHIHDLHLPHNINKAGWHVAHIYNVKDGNIGFDDWDRKELIRRTALNIHPCNYFYISKTNWLDYGGNESVIDFFKTKFQQIYPSIWEEFLELINHKSFFIDHKPTMIQYVYPTKLPIPNPKNVMNKFDDCKVQYEFSRLCFKKDEIEPLCIDENFCVITPKGHFIMTKGEFYETFPNVVKSKSYKDKGIYHYPKIPEKALQYFFPE